jgi:Fe-Mn family superoxide dismutase
MTRTSYKVREFDLGGLYGISDETLEMHFGLYEGYVKQTNLLNEKISGLVGEGRVDKEAFPDYSELNRRLGFEYNGMVLHELYFGNLRRGGSDDRPPRNSAFRKATEASFGDHEIWKADFASLGAMRGVGWVICYQDPGTGALSNHWIDLHEAGNVSGFRPLLVMDVWEHAYLLDYKPADRPRYIGAFFANVDWEAVDQRIPAADLASSA